MAYPELVFLFKLYDKVIFYILGIISEFELYWISFKVNIAIVSQSVKQH